MSIITWLYDSDLATPQHEHIVLGTCIIKCASSLSVTETVNMILYHCVISVLNTRGSYHFITNERTVLTELLHSMGLGVDSN